MEVLPFLPYACFGLQLEIPLLSKNEEIVSLRGLAPRCSNAASPPAVWWSGDVENTSSPFPGWKRGARLGAWEWEGNAIDLGWSNS